MFLFATIEKDLKYVFLNPAVPKQLKIIEHASNVANKLKQLKNNAHNVTLTNWVKKIVKKNSFNSI